MTSRAIAIAILSVLASACAQATEIVLVVDTDLDVPGELTRVEIDVLNSMAAPTRTEVDLTSVGAPPLPLTLGITSRVRADADVRVEVRGYLEGGEILVRDVSTRLTPGSSRMLRVVLARRCIAAACPAGETCDETGCRAVEVDAASLPAWSGSVPRQEGEACIEHEELCNLADDDCDGIVDEEIDLLTDGANCGRCGHACVGSCLDGYCDGEAPSGITAGGAHTCVLRENGSAACFGWNAEGQLGSSALSIVDVPLAVPGPSGLTAIAAGGAFTCVLDGRNAVACVGDGDDGALGRGDRIDGRAVLPVTGTVGFEDLAAGTRHACAIDVDGNVGCWGEGGAGQVGPSGSATSPTPVGLSGATDVSAGHLHSCAVVAGEVWCWGSNARGQLGNAMTFPTSSSAPVRVDGITGATAVAAGRDFTCALLGDGSARCWGANDFGQLGSVTGATTSVDPVTVSGLSGATAITAAAGGTHACALVTGGAVSCWGSNLSGQLGDGTEEPRTDPVSIMNVSGAIAVAAGGLSGDGSGHTCIVLGRGSVLCTGDGRLGQLATSDLAAVNSMAVPAQGLP